jgi:hypothetical protein
LSATFSEIGFEGKDLSAGAGEVPPELADFAIHWAGSFIAYLTDATAAP